MVQHVAAVNYRNVRRQIHTDVSCLRGMLIASHMSAQVKERGLLMVGESGIFTPADVLYVKQVRMLTYDY